MDKIDCFEARPDPGDSQSMGEGELDGEGYGSGQPFLSYKTVDLNEVYLVTDEELGRGEFGVVRRCIDRRTGKSFACKSVEKAKLAKLLESAEELRTEISIMRLLPPHPNIVQMESVHEDSSVHIVMELCRFDLFDLLELGGSFCEVEAAWIFRSAVVAVSCCHSRGVAHLDIKPENILVSRSHHEPSSEGGPYDYLNGVSVKLADFGQSVRLAVGEELHGLVGSFPYTAPEVISGRGYDASADIWSLGVLLYVLLGGYLPFRGKSHLEVLSSIMTTRLDLSSRPWPSVSEAAKELIRWMLPVEPSARPTAREILSHLWLGSSPFHSPVHSLSATTSPNLRPVVTTAPVMLQQAKHVNFYERTPVHQGTPRRGISCTQQPKCKRLGLLRRPRKLVQTHPHTCSSLPPPNGFAFCLLATLARGDAHLAFG